MLFPAQFGVPNRFFLRIKLFIFTVSFINDEKIRMILKLSGLANKANTDKLLNKAQSKKILKASPSS